MDDGLGKKAVGVTRRCPASRRTGTHLAPDAPTASAEGKLEQDETRGGASGGAGNTARNEAGDGEAAAREIIDFREHALKECSRAFPEIVVVMVAKAKQGSINHTRLLFRLGGIEGTVTDRPRRASTRVRSLGELLLDEIEKLRKNARVVKSAEVVSDEQAEEEKERKANGPAKGKDAGPG